MINTYTVTLTHDLLSGPVVADVPATSEDMACKRLRYWAFHEYREPDMLHAECVAVPVDAASV